MRRRVVVPARSESHIWRMHASDLTVSPLQNPGLAPARAWNAIGSMTMCVALLIAAEFMPVSLLSPIARDLHATEGMAGQAISISGLFAVFTSLFIAMVASHFNRRHILMAMTATMLVSVIVISQATSFAMLMVARAFLGVTIGGFWSLAAATIMRMVPGSDVPRALATLYTGNAIATALAAPIGSWLGASIGWRGVFLGLVPLVAANLVWQWFSLPSMQPEAAVPVSRVFALLKRGNVARAMLAIMLTFGGAFAAFTYFRPFLEGTSGVTVNQLSLLLLAQGIAGFIGTSAVGAALAKRLFPVLRGLSFALAALTLLLLAFGHFVWLVAAVLFCWGAVNAAIPVAWSTWLTRGIADEPESGGGLYVACIQLAIMLGAMLGGVLLDLVSITATFVVAAVLLVVGALVIGTGERLQAR